MGVKHQLNEKNQKKTINFTPTSFLSSFLVLISISIYSINSTTQEETKQHLITPINSTPTPPIIPYEFSSNLNFSPLNNITISGILNWNYNIKRSKFTHHSITINGKTFPAKDISLHAFDIDNQFITSPDLTTNCTTSPLSTPMQIFFYWFNSTSPSPIFGSHFIQSENVSLPNGIIETCNLWEMTYYGECGPTVLPPCSQKHFLCATSSNVPVYFEFADTSSPNEKIRLEYYNVVFEEQSDQLFQIDKRCQVYSYPPTAPIGIMDGFEDDQISLLWTPCGEQYARWECGHIFPQKEIVRSGNYAANITIQPGDIAEDDGETERDELDSRPWFIGDRDLWFGFSFFLPINFPIVNDRLVIGQWKQSNAGDKHPIIAQRFINGNWYYTLEVGETPIEFNDIGNLTLGVWHDMIYNIRFSPYIEKGYFKAWHNGSLIIDYSGRTSYAYMSQRFYNKFGIYRDAWNSSWTIFFDKSLFFFFLFFSHFIINCKLFLLFSLICGL